VTKNLRSLNNELTLLCVCLVFCDLCSLEPVGSAGSQTASGPTGVAGPAHGHCMDPGLALSSSAFQSVMSLSVNFLDRENIDCESCRLQDTFTVRATEVVVLQTYCASTNAKSGTGHKAFLLSRHSIQKKPASSTLQHCDHIFKEEWRKRCKDSSSLLLKANG